MLTHIVSTIQVFQTDQYKNFTMIKGNRGLNENKIKKIIKEIESGNDMLQYYPIQVRVVKDKLEILDGQHRYFIAKKLKRPVHYIMVSENKTMAQIARVNSNVEKWKAQNFINCYIQDNNENYLQIQKFIDLYGFSVGIVLSLLDGGHPGSPNGGVESLAISFQSGTFEVKQWDKAVEFAEICKRFSDFPRWRTRGLLIAIYRIRKAKKVSMDDLVEAFKKHPEMLTEQAGFKDYIILLEKIMNVGKQKRIIIT